jgi:hypothetical protein
MWVVLGFPLAAAASVDVLREGGMSLCGIGNGCFGGGVHWSLPTGTFWCKVFVGKVLSLDFPLLTLRLKAKARLLARPCFLFSIYL